MKVTQVTETSESVHTFVEVETGNVYSSLYSPFKAAGWREPAKHVRANIYDYNSLKNGVNVHGAIYPPDSGAQSPVTDDGDGN